MDWIKTRSAPDYYAPIADDEPSMRLGGRRFARSTITKGSLRIVEIAPTQAFGLSTWKVTAGGDMPTKTLAGPFDTLAAAKTACMVMLSAGVG